MAAAGIPSLTPDRLSSSCFWSGWRFGKTWRLLAAPDWGSAAADDDDGDLADDLDDDFGDEADKADDADYVDVADVDAGRHQIFLNWTFEENLHCYRVSEFDRPDCVDNKSYEQKSKRVKN